MPSMIDLFCGTKSISNSFKKAGWDVFTIDNNPQHEPDLCIDVMNLRVEHLPERFRTPTVVWASPPCTCFSVASMGHHWTQPYGTPKTKEAFVSISLVSSTLKLLEVLKPKYYFVENPRGMLRKLSLLIGIPRYTVTYCQYGDSRMKPTDIWTNHPNTGFKHMCKNGMTCHQSAPRGSKTGTQGLKNAMERGRIPQKFCEHITRICE